MSDPINNPHDSFFRDLFNRPDAARDFLQTYLPTELLSHFDLATLTIKKDTFIDKALQSHFSDLIYQVTWSQAKQEKDVFIYLLFEHKSSPETLIMLQLLKYMVMTWEQWNRERPKDHRPIKLVPILPIVFYHGTEIWNIPRHFSALFDMPEAMKPYVPEFQYWLYDTSDYADADIKGSDLLRMGLLALKHIYQEDLPQTLKDILTLWKQMDERASHPREDDSLNFVEPLLRYILGGSDKVSRTELSDIFQEIFPKGEDIMPTILQEVRAEGKAEGKVEGKADGKVEGKADGFRESLRRIFAHIFEIELSHFDDELQNLDLAALEHLNETVFEVESLAELEALLISLRPVPDEPEDD